MKKKILLVATVCFFIVLSGDLMAQKLGYVNSLQILAEMPESQQADQQLFSYRSELNALYEEYVGEYQSELAALNAGGLTEIQGEAKQKDLADLQVRIQEFQQDSQKKLEDKRDELYQPILAKVDQAIKGLASSDGYTYIFDSSAGALLHAPEGDNLLDVLRTKLGIQASEGSK
jgi:outer membrane protein